jgi:hypothetical protein
MVSGNSLIGARGSHVPKGCPVIQDYARAMLILQLVTGSLDLDRHRQEGCRYRRHDPSELPRLSNAGAFTVHWSDELECRINQR